MGSCRNRGEIRPLSGSRGNTASVEQAEVLDDVRRAEEQIERGKGVEHAEARRQVPERLRR